MSLLVSPNPFEFFQFAVDSEVTLVLMPTFVDVVFYDESTKEVNWLQSGVSQCCEQLGPCEPHLPA